MSVSFNTTSVATLDKLGKLYKTAIPLSDDPASEALVYSTSAIAENKLAPTTAVYLKNNDVLYLKSRYKNNISGTTNNLRLITTVLGSVLAFYLTIKNLNL